MNKIPQPITCPLCAGSAALTSVNATTEQAFVEGYFMGVALEKAVVLGLKSHAFLCDEHLESGRKMAAFVRENAPDVGELFPMDLPPRLRLVPVKS